jgi:hypothetical protein
MGCKKSLQPIRLKDSLLFVACGFQAGKAFQMFSYNGDSKYANKIDNPQII